MKDGMEKNEPVIFRIYRNGDVIALFPEIACDTIGYNCQSYMQVGQHGAASPQIVINKTKLATPKEYAVLKKELEYQIGYHLKVIKRFRYKHQQIRMAMYS